MHAHAANDASERHGRQMREMEEALKAASASASVLQEEWQVHSDERTRRIIQNPYFSVLGTDMAA